MKFHEWKTVYQAARDGHDECALRLKQHEWLERQRTISEAITRNEFIPQLESAKQVGLAPDVAISVWRQQTAMAEIEYAWVLECRPYYKVYPCITQALLRLNLSQTLRDMKIEDRILCVRFAEGCEPVVGINSILSVLTISIDGDVMFSAILGGEATGFATGIKWIKQTDEGTIDEILERCLGFSVEDILVNSETERTVAKIALTCHLLADDPSVITPDVLGKDRDKYNRTTDAAARLAMVSRARRRGVVGWNIGADYEVCPHYRRPHFGLRHTGKGRTVPRIVPIKGAVVHRSRLTEVPTGYMLPDGTEVEHGKVVSNA